MSYTTRTPSNKSYAPQQQYAPLRQASLSRRQAPTPPAPRGRQAPNPAPSNGSANVSAGRQALTAGVATGAVGAGYGPYAHRGVAKDPSAFAGSRFSNEHSESNSLIKETSQDAPPANTQTVPAFMWDNADPDLDDALHNPDPIRDAALDRSFDVFSGRGWANASALFILIAGLITLFAGYPIIAFYGKAPQSDLGASNIGGTNSTGQVSAFSNMPTLIDKDTDSSVYTKTGTDGKTYNLVFSDEFETDGRTFWPGDDPFWEAVDLYYWPTNDIEWFDPGQITTKDGKLVITMVEKNNHNLNFQSGMLQSWNKLCFTTGIIEVSVSLPGSPEAPGFWPGVWTMGNLGRAGYGATTEGTWPYSYDSCDVGTFPNQTNPDGTTPQAALTGSPEGGELSFLPGQRLSACTCPGSDHPGPKVSNGRNVPEIDILEAQVDVSVFRGQASQSYQTAPFNFQYDFDNSSSSSPIYDESITQFNSYKGGQFQQALSAVTYIDASFYNDNAYSPYSFEWWSNPSQRDEGYITWSVNDQKTWTVTAASLAGDTETEISSRIIPEEPMSIILNFGMAPGFQEQDFQHLQFPSEMRIDYVRIYQRDDVKDGLGCDPSSHPTSDYITDHANAYSNPNLTTWAQAGYDFPRNSKYDGC